MTIASKSAVVVRSVVEVMEVLPGGEAIAERRPASPVRAAQTWGRSPHRVPVLLVAPACGWCGRLPARSRCGGVAGHPGGHLRAGGEVQLREDPFDVSVDGAR